MDTSDVNMFQESLNYINMIRIPYDFTNWGESGGYSTALGRELDLKDKTVIGSIPGNNT